MRTSRGQRTAMTSTRRVSGSVFVNYLLSNLGYYTLLPILPLLLTLTRHAGPWLTGAALSTLGLSVRAACLMMSGLLHRLSVRVSASGGLAIAAAGFGLLATSSDDTITIGCLALAGLGISVNTLVARAYVTLALTTAGARNTAFAAIQVAVNLAAATGPIAANALFSSGHMTLCLALVAVMYSAAAAAVATVLPPRLRPADRDASAPRLRNGLRAIAAEQAVRRTAALAVTGWFLYGQLFSALTLHISEITASALLRSSFFTADALLIVLLQIPVTGYATRRLATGTWCLRRGLACFGVAFALLAVAGSSIAGTFAGVAVFAFAETLFTPFVSSAFAELSATRPIVEAFVLLQIVMAIGEPGGAFTGGALLSIAAAHHVEPAYWSCLAALAITAAAAFSRGETGPAQCRGTGTVRRAADA